MRTFFRRPIRLTSFILGCSVGASALAAVPVASGILDDTKASVVALRAHVRNSSIAHGSGVVISFGKVITNCHVVAGAERIDVFEGHRRHTARLAAQNIPRDLCLLDVPALTAPAAHLTSVPPSAGDKIFAAGFGGATKLTGSEGHVVAVHEYDGAVVIQVSARFDYGSSGGGLFDNAGRLVGVLTFKARAGGPFHFAVPVAWFDTSLDAAKSSAGGRAFWQQSGRELPYFLRAVSLEASRNWNALADLAREWMQREPANPGALRALTKANSHSARNLSMPVPLHTATAQ